MRTTVWGRPKKIVRSSRQLYILLQLHLLRIPWHSWINAIPVYNLSFLESLGSRKAILLLYPRSPDLEHLAVSSMQEHVVSKSALVSHSLSKLSNTFSYVHTGSRSQSNLTASALSIMPASRPHSNSTNKYRRSLSIPSLTPRTSLRKSCSAPELGRIHWFPSDSSVMQEYVGDGSHRQHCSQEPKVTLPIFDGKIEWKECFFFFS